MLVFRYTNFIVRVMVVTRSPNRGLGQHSRRTRIHCPRSSRRDSGQQGGVLHSNVGEEQHGLVRSVGRRRLDHTVC